VILNANEGAVYDNEFTSETELTYDGEGEPEEGDQILTNANEAIVDAVDEEFPIYLLTSEDGLDEYEYEYEGLVEVTGARYEYEQSEDRMKYEFDLQKLGVATWNEYQDIAEEVEENAGEPLDETTNREETIRLVRSAAFKRKEHNIGQSTDIELTRADSVYTRTQDFDQSWQESVFEDICAVISEAYTDRE
jgi:putative restriction endonuclease